MIKIYLPSNNLNCYGISINLYIIQLYIDMFKLENKFKGIFYKFSIPNKTSVNGYFYFNGFIKMDIWYLLNKSYKIRFNLYPIKYLIRIYSFINGNCIYSFKNQNGYIDKTLFLLITFFICFIIFIVSYNIETVINGIPIIKQVMEAYQSLLEAL